MIFHPLDDCCDSSIHRDEDSDAKRLFSENEETKMSFVRIEFKSFPVALRLPAEFLFVYHKSYLLN